MLKSPSACWHAGDFFGPSPGNPKVGLNCSCGPKAHGRETVTSASSPVVQPRLFQLTLVTLQGQLSWLGTPSRCSRNCGLRARASRKGTSRVGSSAGLHSEGIQP
eukprot:3419141-Amphidinium_carterae.1